MHLLHDLCQPLPKAARRPLARWNHAKKTSPSRDLDEELMVKPRGANQLLVGMMCRSIGRQGADNGHGLIFSSRPAYIQSGCQMLFSRIKRCTVVPKRTAIPLSVSPYRTR